MKNSKTTTNLTSPRHGTAKKYRSTVLDALDPADILSKIKDFDGDSNAYLLCYEAPEKFCHRHMLAARLNFGINAGVEEWEQKNEDQK